MKHLIVGLGNIGEEYKFTRHNIGFQIIDHLASVLDCKFDFKRHAFYASGKYKSRSLHLLKPSNFVNNSGKAVQYWSKELKIRPENILVICDDLSLPFGKIRLKKSGSDGGHNGLKSINDHLNTLNYPRLRFGIDSNFKKGYQSEYVLGEFNAEEQKFLNFEIEKATEIALSFCQVGAERTMNKYN